MVLRGSHVSQGVKRGSPEEEAVEGKERETSKSSSSPSRATKAASGV